MPRRGFLRDLPQRVEWGTGIYGAESVCRYYDGAVARNSGPQQAARLSAILPASLKRHPERMNSYSGLILSGCAKWVGDAMRQPSESPHRMVPSGPWWLPRGLGGLVQRPGRSPQGR